MKAFVLGSLAALVAFGAKYGHNNLSEDAVLVTISIFLAAGVLAFNR